MAIRVIYSVNKYGIYNGRVKCIATRYARNMRTAKRIAKELDPTGEYTEIWPVHPSEWGWVNPADIEG